MKVKDLITKLQQLNPELDVVDIETMEPVIDTKVINNKVLLVTAEDAAEDDEYA